MRLAIAVMIAGGFGTLVRYWVDGLVSSHFGTQFPIGIFIINVVGAFLLGFCFTFLTDRLVLDAWMRFAITTGFIGAFTTFSTMTFNTAQMLSSGNIGFAVVNSLGSVCCGIIASYSGIVLGRIV